MADVPVVTGSNDGQPHTTNNNIGTIYYRHCQIRDHFYITGERTILIENK